MSLRSTVFFAGWGGDSQGFDAVPGVTTSLAGNHNPICVEVHALNFPDTFHLPPGDVRKIDLATLPYTELFWASPACPAWTDAKGKKRYFDRSNQYTLIEDTELGELVEDPAEARSRALIEQIPRYLRAMAGRGTPVLGGVMENVIQCRRWDKWAEWRRSIEEIGPGYEVAVIALNSMHAMPRVCSPAPQSRDRLYVMYWLKTLGRRPDLDKWLRPRAFCDRCDKVVDAIQSWKQPGVEMGRYGAHGQYVYRCPSKTCAYQVVEPFTTPASAAINWDLDPGQKIGERTKPLAAATLDRIRIGLEKYAGEAMLSPAGGTWRTAATPLSEPMSTRTTRETDALVLPPMVVQTSKRSTQHARTAGMPMPTQTTRRELGVAIPPFLTSLRGGGSKKLVYGVDQPLATFSASGFHHGLVSPPGTEQGREELLVPYYRTGVTRPVTDPMGTLTTRDRFGLLGVDPDRLLAECTFRMLDPDEIRDGMAFRSTFKPIGDKRTQAAGYGNAVTPPTAEVLGCALAEAITGEPIERFVN
ncbi:DNA cytosine methyltransferase [Nocardia alba]|uniref:DNA (Cytosine-5)-methyltransferase 1 n=1 Tax=Nocardia alba TaxID=225051 RepID=A0A4R1F8A0_9NOCA|nr:DNA cytosine methyltransferase [Nocardia alba]TCJ88088.1 DNA (cytosine-5)-methyltransferase 1 [Nocardia alba]